MPSIKEDFGELRSLMQFDELNDAQRSQLFELMRRAWESDAALYNAQWLDYMSGFARHFVRPIAHLTSVEALEQAVERMPHARFTLKLWNKNIGVQGVRTLAQSPHLSRLVSFELGYDRLGIS
jgi:hypothetical protein